MYAIISDRGRRHRVQVGDVIRCDLKGDLEPGQDVTFDEVALVSSEGEVRVGAPALAGASVKGRVVDHVAGDKLIVFKFKRRKGSRTRRGHRQKYTAVEITEISA